MKHIIIVLILTLLLVSCGITDFEMPSWDVDLTSIPLMNEYFPASDLEGENIVIQDGNLVAVVEDQLEETTPELSKNISDSTFFVPINSNEQVSIDFEIQSLNTNTNFRIQEGTFDSGEMIIHYRENYANFDTLKFTFNQMLDNDGETLQLNLTEEDFIDDRYIINLAGKKLTDQNIDGEFWLINIDIYASSQTIADGQEVGEVKLSINDRVFFRDFLGFIDDIQSLDSESNVDIDYPNEVENAVTLDEISMYFNVFNEIGFEFELMGDLVAYRDGTAIDTISLESLNDVDFTIPAAPEMGVINSSTIEIVGNDRINQMLRLMPDKIALSNPTYIVNNIDDENPGFVSIIEHSVWSEYRIEIPFRATFNDDYIIYPDKLYDVEISQDNQELIDERVNEAEIALFVENTYPIGGILDIYISSQELSPDEESLETAELQLTNYDIEVSADQQSYSIQLDKDDLDLFINEKIYMRTSVRFHNSDGVVVILPQDNLSVKANLQISVRID